MKLVCVAQRIRAGIIVNEDGCWVWTKALDPTGYGRIGVRGGRMAYTHRVMAEMFHGPIPGGMTVDHLCRNTACCNPMHLEVVTYRENHRRGARGPHHFRGLDCGVAECSYCNRHIRPAERARELAS